MSSSRPIRVIKLGGSLLCGNVISQLPNWLARQRPMINLMVVGGGAFVDVVRQFDALHELNARVAHDLCIDVMSLTARLVMASLGGVELIPDIESVHALKVDNGKAWIVDMREFLHRRRNVSFIQRLPVSWEVTSDSLSGAVAISVGAAELVLLKSCLPGKEIDAASLSRSGYVDMHFAQLVDCLPPVRCVNARSGFVEA